VPVDLRPRGEPVPATLGNRFGIVFVKLPLSVADPVARVRAVHDRMAAVKAGAQAASTFAILAVVGALPSWAHRLAVRVLGAKSTAIVTNVPGPTAPVYLAGARLVRLTFWVPQAGSVGLGVSILSYAGDVTIGVAADRNLVPDPRVLVAAAEDELADLVRVTLGVPDDAPHAGGLCLYGASGRRRQRTGRPRELVHQFVLFRAHGTAKRFPARALQAKTFDVGDHAAGIVEQPQAADERFRQALVRRFHAHVRPQRLAERPLHLHAIDVDREVNSVAILHRVFR